VLGKHWIADDFLSGCPDPGRGGTVTYSGSQLTATATGVHLTIMNLYERGTVLNEDIEARDEIYIKVRWINGDGATLRACSNQVNGWF
jgi:hypothetical protein